MVDTSVSISKLQALRFGHDSVDRIGSLCFGLLFWFALGGAILLGASDNRSSVFDKVSGELLLTSGFIFTALLLLNAFLRTSDVLVDDEGFRRVLFGKIWRSLPWKKIRKIRISNTPDFANFGPPINVYYFESATNTRMPWSFNGPIVFSSKIQRIEEMLAVIDQYVSRFNITILDCRVKPPTHLRKLT